MRFHVHTHVEDLQASIAFYSKMFCAEPVRVEKDYAKFVLSNPPLNFALSSRGGKVGIDHLGFQAVFSESRQATPSPAAQASACCAPRGKPVGISVKAGSSCC